MPDLEIERDPEFDRTERTAHRLGVALMTLALVAGALGFFGYGPLSIATRPGPGYTVTYDRFARNGAEFRIDLQQSGSAPLQVWVDSGLLDATKLDRVVPEAAEERPDEQGIMFVFADDGGANRQARLFFTSDTVGLVRGRVGRSATDAVSLSAFFYP